MRRIISAVATTAALALLLPGGASAHTLTVTPTGKDPVHLNRPVAQLWVQGHCRAQAPAELAASPGAAHFTPGGALPCDPANLNPGGQSTGP